MVRFKNLQENKLGDYWKDRGFSVPRYLTDDQLELLEYNPEYKAYKNTPCIVCNGTGKYRYKSKTYECKDDDYGHIIMRLARLYWLCNIPLQYQQLLWDEWPDNTKEYRDARETIDKYVSNFDGLRLNGVGLTFYGELGLGKTWGASSVLKSLVKQGVDGWFTTFSDVKSYHEIEDYSRKEYFISRIRESSILVLDEVKKPWSDASRRFFSDRLEELIRPRTNANLPTIITTNMTMEEIESVYPRIFSLLMMKNIEVPLIGTDARVTDSVWERQVGTIFGGERLPID